jgi:DNA-binding IscR family transcriptional regulator
MLNKAPEEITLAEILRCIHGAVFEPAALQNKECPQALRKVWSDMQTTLDQKAESVNFQQILEEDNQTREMYYI